jgi:hypothetical protein
VEFSANQKDAYMTGIEKVMMRLFVVSHSLVVWKDSSGQVGYCVFWTKKQPTVGRAVREDLRISLFRFSRIPVVIIGTFVKDLTIEVQEVGSAIPTEVS